MKNILKGLKYVLVGILFGIIMTKSEAISWYRIQEMFLFQSIHMYGIIGVAVTIGMIQVVLIKKFELRDIKGEPILFQPKEKGFYRYIFGGTIFGLGWAMTGACPGPMYTLLGHGFLMMLVVIGGALLGTFTYGVLKDRLPH